MEPRFVFDSSKSANNALKHGIDFVRAQELWVDEKRIEIEARTEGERRWMVIGRIGTEHWTAVVTRRRALVRLISVRRARKGEIRRYEG